MIFKWFGERRAAKDREIVRRSELRKRHAYLASLVHGGTVEENGVRKVIAPWNMGYTKAAPTERQRRVARDMADRALVRKYRVRDTAEAELHDRLERRWLRRAGWEYGCPPP